MLAGNTIPDSKNTTNRIYKLEKFKSVAYENFFKNLEQKRIDRQNAGHDVRKWLLRERITGSGAHYGASYLDYNAQTVRDSETIENTELLNFEYVENLSKTCKCNAAWMSGNVSGDTYIKLLDCRKQWCPTCGGKNGTIHKSRIHAIMNRFGAEKYNLRQFVFTVPDNIREMTKSKDDLNYLFCSAKGIIEKFFGEPIFDRHGHINNYRLEKGALSYLHVFGEEKGVYKPHINIHVIEKKNVKMKLEAAFLESIKKCWIKKLQKYDATITESDIHYSFRINAKKVMHAIKYMCRPWSADDYAAITDESLKRLLVSDLSGFQYLRFWGAMASCRYKDDMEKGEVVEEIESKVKEPLQLMFIAPFEIFSWGPHIEQIEDSLFKLKKRGLNYEPEIIEKIEAARKRSEQST